MNSSLSLLSQCVYAFLGGVGVAYQAKVSAIRVLDSYRKSTDIEEAEALGYRPDVNCKSRKDDLKNN